MYDMDSDNARQTPSSDELYVCVSCEKARLGAELWDEFKMESLLNPELQIRHGLCPRCESRLQNSLGLMSRMQAF